MIPKKSRTRKTVSVRAKTLIDALAPELGFLKRIGERARHQGKNRLSIREINAEIAAVRTQLKEGAIRRSARDRAIANDEFVDGLEIEDSPFQIR